MVTFVLVLAAYVPDLADRQNMVARFPQGKLSVPGFVFRRLVRVGNPDDVQRLVQAFGVLPPLRGFQGEDRADGRVGSSSTASPAPNGMG